MNNHVKNMYANKRARARATGSHEFLRLKSKRKRKRHYGTVFCWKTSDVEITPDTPLDPERMVIITGNSKIHNPILTHMDVDYVVARIDTDKKGNRIYITSTARVRGYDDD